MITYSFENRGNKPYYQYLYEMIKEDIEKGVLVAHTKLPSKRNFAKQLGLSVMTIENAYEQLMVEGYLYAKEKRGYYVDEVKKSSVEARQENERKYLEREEKNREEIRMDFTSNHVSRESFPMNTWSSLMRSVLRDQADEVLLPSHPQGNFILRKEIAQHLYHFRGMNVSPEQIVIGAGTEYLYQILIQLLGRDRIYGVEDPGYQKLASIYRSNDVNCKLIPVKKRGISMEVLEKESVEIMHISPAHHFPTGIVMPISQRQKLLDWSRNKENRYIIEDDYDCEFRLTGLPIPTLFSIDSMERVIYLNTFSKSLTPSIRISYMILPEQLLGQFQEKLGFYSCTVANFEQFTLAAFLAQGYFEKHINRMRNYYKKRRNDVISIFRESSLWQIAKITEEDAGLHFLLELKTKKSDDWIMSTLEKSGIRIKSLSFYTRNPKQVQSHVFVVNYTALDTVLLPEILEEIFFQIA